VCGWGCLFDGDVGVVIVVVDFDVWDEGVDFGLL